MSSSTESPHTEASRSAVGPVGRHHTEELVERLAARTLLAVWAHPDDESYLGGALMAAAAAAGARVVNVTATLGEHGTDDPDRFPPRELAAVRHGELAAAVDVLDVEEWTTLGFADGGCGDVPDAIGVRRIGTILDEVEPDVVVTFGPDGVTGHPDHRAVGRWTATAVARRRTGAALLTTAVGESWPEDLVAGMHRVEAFWPGYPERHGPGPRHDVTVEGRLLDRKLRAIDAHASQVGPLRRELGPVGFRRLAAVEAYRPANQIASQLLSGSRARNRAAA